jgi:formylglycine-generating enzyme required for sulfatase activity
MAKVSYGTYQVGRDPANENHSAQRNIPLDNFWIDIHEVTNGQYQQFLQQTGSQPPAVWPGEENFPVRGVTWDQAAAYCSWAKKRLPSEAEWEVAGRGTGSNAPLFPWGNNDPSAGGQTSKLPVDDTYEVGTFAFNVSPFGVYDMAGNVWEWVAEPYDTVPAGEKILRGGQFGLIEDMAFRQPAQADDPRFVPYTGFRCAANQVEEK